VFHIFSFWLVVISLGFVSHKKHCFEDNTRIFEKRNTFLRENFFTYLKYYLGKIYWAMEVWMET